MKILLLYTPRSGTNSIADYFIKQNPDYIYYNQPFSLYSEGSIKKESYKNCINHSNVFIKSEITNFLNLKIDKNKVVKDFDKIFLISRKNKTEQGISYIIAQNGKSFLNKNQRMYFIDNIKNEQLEEVTNNLINSEKMLFEFKTSNMPIFYYEDLFYGDFSKLFEYLELKYVENDFKEILDKSKKYMSGTYNSKKEKTLI